MRFESVDILSYFDDLGINYATEGVNVSQGWAGITCPLCGDTSNHLGVNLAAKTFGCFRCGETGNALKLVMMLEGCNKTAALKRLRKFSKTEFIYKQKERVPASTIEMPDHISKNFTSDFTSYLEGRRFDPEYIIKKYDLFCGGYVGFFKYRIVIPVYLKQDIVTFTGRDITDQLDLRYKSYPIEKSMVPIKHTLYNIDTVKDRCVVVEGVLDAWHIGDGAVATFGTKVTQAQILSLSRIKKVFVMFDSDATKVGKKLAQTLSLFTKVEQIEMSKGDPGDLKDYEVSELRRDLRL